MPFIKAFTSSLFQFSSNLNQPIIFYTHSKSDIDVKVVNVDTILNPLIKIPWLTIFEIFGNIL